MTSTWRPRETPVVVGEAKKSPTDSQMLHAILKVMDAQYAPLEKYTKEQALVSLLISLPLAIGTIPARIFVAAQGWTWFVTPITGVQAPSLFILYGAYLTINLFRASAKSYAEDAAKEQYRRKEGNWSYVLALVAQSVGIYIGLAAVYVTMWLLATQGGN